MSVSKTCETELGRTEACSPLLLWGKSISTKITQASLLLCKKSRQSSQGPGSQFTVRFLEHIQTPEHWMPYTHRDIPQQELQFLLSLNIWAEMWTSVTTWSRKQVTSLFNYRASAQIQEATQHKTRHSHTYILSLRHESILNCLVRG